MKFLGVRQLGALLADGAATPTPRRPWLIDLSVLKPFEGLVAGDIASFEERPDMDRWRIGDTSADPMTRLRWIEIETSDRRLLVCDRVILMRVSWDDLDAAGYVRGRSVTVDGESYVCRLLTGGDDFRTPDDGFGGGTPSNEWDALVSGEARVAGLPAPLSTDLDGELNDVDLLSEHNRFWNWFGAVSWKQEPFRH
jgi:hypothetical protein